jgi:hypothetical protein
MDFTDFMGEKTFHRKDEKVERGQPQPNPELPADHAD